MAFQPPPLTGNAVYDRWLLAWFNSLGSPATQGATGDHAQLGNLNTDSYSHLTSGQLTGLVGGSSTDIHFHPADRSRANHTGQQLAASIVDFNAAVAAASNPAYILAFAAANG